MPALRAVRGVSAGDMTRLPHHSSSSPHDAPEVSQLLTLTSWRGSRRSPVQPPVSHYRDELPIWPTRGWVRPCSHAAMPCALRRLRESGPARGPLTQRPPSPHRPGHRGISPRIGIGEGGSVSWKSKYPRPTGWIARPGRICPAGPATQVPGRPAGSGRACGEQALSEQGDRCERGPSQLPIRCPGPPQRRAR